MASITVRQRNGTTHEVLYDDSDHDIVSQHTWHVQRDTRSRDTLYAATAIRQQDGSYRKVRMHKLITGWPDADHIDHNGLNNHRSNLREATRPLQGANRRKNRNGSSRFKGVSWSVRDQKWVAGIRINGRRRELGRFPDETDAAKAYDQAAIQAWGEFANLNFEALGG